MSEAVTAHVGQGEPSPLEGASRRVLIVDDDVDMCELIAASMGKVFSVTWKTSVEEALVEIGLSDFDVVVTDLRMPRSSGLELCARVKERRPDVPVVWVDRDPSRTYLP